ncbi:carbohydrate kinase family protein [Vulcanisaeta thermophila]|uniref:carbohydrate kinase family protein n=1 Tax=Vulcanisaeta thermophila TaxID=867917 RepID=UPI001389B526|nr:carbohydrate kinase family protein [Vulcanisaeta thermophila]
MKPDVIVLGDCVIDIFYLIEKLPVNAGDIAISSDLRIRPGGSCNVAIMLRRLGVNVGVIDRFGTDPLSNSLTSELRGLGITVMSKVMGGVITVSNNVVDGHGDHAFIGYVGTNAYLSPEDINEELIASSRALFTNGFSAMSRGTVKETARKAINLALGHGKYLFFDVGPIIEPSSDLYGVVMGLNYHERFVFMNEDEARRLFGRDVRDVQGILAGLDGVFLIKLGAHGAVVIEDNRVIKCPAFRPRFVVNSVGAGDVFDAVFMTGVLRGLDYYEACSLASFLASLKLEYVSVADMPSLTELRARAVSEGLGQLFSRLVD